MIKFMLNNSSFNPGDFFFYFIKMLIIILNFNYIFLVTKSFTSGILKQPSSYSNSSPYSLIILGLIKTFLILLIAGFSSSSGDRSITNKLISNPTCGAAYQYH